MQGHWDDSRRKEVTKMGKFILPILLPIFFVLCSRSIYKPGFELPSMIVVAAIGVVFGCLINYAIIQAHDNNTTNQNQ